MNTDGGGWTVLYTPFSSTVYANKLRIQNINPADITISGTSKTKEWKCWVQ